MGMYERPASFGSAIRVLFGPILRLQSYKNIIYLVLAFPIGLFYAMILGFSLFFGIVFSIILVGLLILALFIVLVRIFTGFERWLSNKLLAVMLDAPDESLQGDGTVSTLRNYLDAPTTWRGLGFVTLKLWLGIIGIILVFGFSTAFSMVRSLVDRPTGVEFGEVNGDPVVWTIETLPEAGLAAVLGIGLAWVLLHLANLFGYVAGRMSVALLQ